MTFFYQKLVSLVEIKNQNVTNRFFFSLFGNGFRGLLSLLTAALVARWLGPTDYGRLAFLLVSFTAFRNLLDMASSSAFFTFVSQRQRTSKFIAYYGFFILLQLFISTVFLLLLPAPWVDTVWKGEARRLVIIGFIATFLQGSVWNMVNYLMESDRKTSHIQFFSTVLTLIHLGVVTLLWFSSYLGIMAILMALAFEYALASFWVIRLYFRNRKHQDFPDKEESLRIIFSEYARFCKPFIPYTLIGFAYEFGDRWMLQHWGGADQQAYYALASQFGTVALLATTSILKIFWKEIAEAIHQGNQKQAEDLYQKISQKLFFIGCLLAGILAPWSSQIVSWILGPAYVAGASTLLLMLFYPIHQSIGQIVGTVFLATGQAAIYTLLGIFFMAASLVISYLFLAPKTASIPGLELGALGLAAKMVIAQLFHVYIATYILRKKLKWKSEWVKCNAVIIGTISAVFFSQTIPGPIIPKQILATAFVIIIIFLYWKKKYYKARRAN